MKKRLIIISAAMVVFAGIAVAAYAAYDVGGSSAPSGFTAGTAANLTVDPEEWDLDGILPGQIVPMDVWVANSNPVPATVTGLTATFNDGGACAFTVAWPTGSYGLPASGGFWDTLTVTMGDAAPSCEGNAGLLVTATATGTLP